MDTKQMATDIIKKLNRAGFIAYFAGGWVRDYIMSHPSDDIDIATNAPPEVILDLFPRTILVGLAFGVVIVAVDGHQFEVATFRKDFGYTNGRKPSHIELASPQEDAKRRDFTINGMFYDPLEDKVHDYVSGIEDIHKKVIRTIGDPQERFFEDRLRMIRAVRFSARFGFAIDPETQEAIKQNADTLFPAVAMERVWQEFSKMSAYSNFNQALIEMFRLELLETIFPQLKGVPLNEIKRRVDPLRYLPQGYPTVVFLLELFPHEGLEGLLDIGKYLKISTRDLDLLEFLYRFRKNEPDNLPDWARFYAHGASGLALSLASARLPEANRQGFLQQHQAKQDQLSPFIARLRNKRPLVTAALLQNEGIAPGKSMGLLLKEAENLSIAHNLDDPDAVIALLKTTPYFKGV